MKWLFSLLISVSAVAAPLNSETWGLSWDQPTNMPVMSVYAPGTNQAYQILATATLNTPLPQWTNLVTWTSWSLVTNGNGSISLSNNLTLPFGSWFLFVNPTNVHGAAPLTPPFFGALGVIGPVWSTVNNSSLSKQGP